MKKREIRISPPSPEKYAFRQPDNGFLVSGGKVAPKQH
jgi:hypothetical protein